MRELRLEAMKLAMQAALQYGAFDIRNLTPIESKTPGHKSKPDYDFAENYDAIPMLAEAIYVWINNVEDQPQIDPRLAEIVALANLRGIKPTFSAELTDESVSD